MKIIYRYRKLCALGHLALLALSSDATAATPDLASNGPVVAGFGNFIKKISKLADAAITQPDFVWWYNALFFVGACCLCIVVLGKYAFKKLLYADVLATVFMILIVQVLITNFASIMDASWSAAEGIASSLQMGMIGTRDAFFAPQMITNLFKNMTFSLSLIVNPLSAVMAAAGMVILSVITLLLSVLSYISIIWGFWGFTLSKLIGLTCIPTLLFERFSFIFDGWLKFYLGFLIYYIIARLNVVLVACSLAIYYGLGIPFGINQATPIEMPLMTSFFDGLGVFTFTIVGLLALFSTGRFAGTIIAGAGGGGMGPAIMGAARAAAKIL